MYARGCIIGLTRGTKREHIIRAAQEAIAYQSLELVEAMEKDCKIKLGALHADGGASSDNFLMGFQADILDKPIIRSQIKEITALGAAYLAGLSAGVWKSQHEIVEQRKKDYVTLPNMTSDHREKLLQGWRKAVSRSFDWEERS